MQFIHTLSYIFLLSIFVLPASAADQDSDMISVLRQAQSGNSNAQLNLEYIYQHLGKSNAQINLGYLYQSLGKSQQDLQTAIRWYEQAAASGHASAAFALGLMHEHGQGVEKNLVKAVDWYTKAARLYASHGTAVPYKLAKDAIARLQPNSLMLAQQKQAP
jgi:TPR repeat protein